MRNILIIIVSFLILFSCNQQDRNKIEIIPKKEVNIEIYRRNDSVFSVIFINNSKNIIMFIEIWVIMYL
jgi:hypothetical protein